MSAGSPMRALAWKEFRDLWAVVAGGLAGLVLLTVALQGDDPQAWAFVLVVIIAPGLAAVLGGVSLAEERASGAEAFLRARAAGEAMILGVKLAAHGVAALLLSGAALLMGALIGVGDSGWCAALQTTSERAWILGLALVPAMFILGVAISMMLPDALSAAPAAAIGGAMWTAIILLPPIGMAGSVDTGLSELPLLAAAIAIGATALLAMIAGKKGLLARRDGSRSAPGWLIPGVLGGLVAFCFLGPLTREPVQARTILAGSASVVGSDIVTGARGGAVAFVASPESGRTRAVVSLVDERRVVSLSVLAPGTRPLGWSQAEDAFVVEWPDGARRLVSTMGDVRPARDEVPDSVAEHGPYVARAGRLVRVDAAGELVAFPREEVGP